jgi:hypothetical protein
LATGYRPAANGRTVAYRGSADGGGILFALIQRGGRVEMLYTLAVILLIAWLLGVVGTYTIGSFVHALLVIAIVLFLVGMLSGRRTLP